MSAPTTPAGRPDADLDEAYRQMPSRLRAFIASRVGNPETAEDLTQEVLLRLVRSGSAVDDPPAWLGAASSCRERASMSCGSGIAPAMTGRWRPTARR